MTVRSAARQSADQQLLLGKRTVRNLHEGICRDRYLEVLASKQQRTAAEKVQLLSIHLLAKLKTTLFPESSLTERCLKNRLMMFAQR